MQEPLCHCCQLCGLCALTLTVIIEPFEVAANAARACSSAVRESAACSTKSTAPVRMYGFPSVSMKVDSNSIVTRNVSTHRPSVLRGSRYVCGQQHPQWSKTALHCLVCVIVAYCRHARDATGHLRLPYTRCSRRLAPAAPRCSSHGVGWPGRRRDAAPYQGI